MGVTHHSKVNVQLGLVAGGTAGNHTLTGVAIGDTINSVWALTTGTNGSYGTVDNLTSEFTDPIAAANVIANAAGTNTTNRTLIVLWSDQNLS